MSITLDAFIAANLGRKNVGDTPENMGQCVGLVELWLDVHNKPHIWGDAAKLLDNAPAGVYLTVKNGPVNYPPYGSIVVWGPSWGNGHGHTAVVLAANANLMAVFEQNEPVGSPPVVATHGYGGVIGWMWWR